MVSKAVPHPWTTPEQSEMSSNEKYSRRCTSSTTTCSAGRQHLEANLKYCPHGVSDGQCIHVVVVDERATRTLTRAGPTGSV